MALTNQINISELPEEFQQQLLDEIQKRLPKKGRASSTITKESKLYTVANILLAMRGLNLAQQRSVLQFALRIIENTQKRYWRNGR